MHFEANVEPIMDEHEPTRRRHSRYRAWAFSGAVMAATVVLIALLWFVWGFRWPPTAVVVLSDAPKPASEQPVQR